MIGCSANESLEKPEPLIKDPLKAAREELFSEIGIDDADIKNTKESELPTVLPTPPTLPAIDSDLSGLPIE